MSMPNHVLVTAASCSALALALAAVGACWWLWRMGELVDRITRDRE